MNNTKIISNSIKISIKTYKALSEREDNIIRRHKAIEISKGGKKYTYNQVSNGGWLIDGYNPY